MPPIETSDLHQYAVLWEASGVGTYGKQTVLSPVEIRCRWEATQRTVLGPEGNPVALDSIVVVSREIPVRSIMWLGKLQSLPTTPTDLREVWQYSDIPDLGNRHFRRTVLLVKHSDSLPTLV